jgi:hypothetical protein
MALAVLGTSAPAGACTLTWSVVPSPNEGNSENLLGGVSCVRSAACTTSGIHSARTLIESGTPRR